MTQMVLNIEDTSLVDSLKAILTAIKGVTIDRLIDGQAVEAEKRFIKSTIETGFQQARKGDFAGKNLTSLDGLVAELREEAE